MSGKGEEMLLLFKKRTLLVDDLIKMNAELKLKLSSGQVDKQDKSCQSEAKKTKSVLIQTEDTQDKSSGEAKANKKGFIQFFKFGKKPAKKPRVKFLKSGRFESDENPMLETSRFMTGHRPPFSAEDHQFVLPHASSALNKSAKRKSSSSSAKAAPQAKKAKKSETKSVQLSPIKRDIPKVACNNSQAIIKDLPKNPIKKDASKKSEAKINELTKNPLKKDASKKSEAKIIELPKSPMKKEATKKTAVKKEAVKDKQKNIDELRDEEIIEKVVANKRSSLMNLTDMIPLGKAHAVTSSRNERSAHNIKLTPEALAAINARKVTVKKPMLPLPKRPFLENIDPTQKKKLPVTHKSDKKEAIMDPAPAQTDLKKRLSTDNAESFVNESKDLEKASEDASEHDNVQNSDEVEVSKETDNEEPSEKLEPCINQTNDKIEASNSVTFEMDADSVYSDSSSQVESFRDDQEQSKAEQVKNVKSLDLITMSFLERMIHKFKHENANRWQELLSKGRSTKSKDQLDQDLTHNVVRIQIARLWSCSTQEVLMNIVKNLTSHDKCTINKRLICQNVYLAIREEKEWEANLIDQGLNKPKLTWKQVKALTLLIHLELPMPGILLEMRSLIHKFLLASKNGLQNYKLYQLANVVRFFIAILRHHGDETSARLFVYDILFFRNTRSHVVINVMLETWPHIFHMYPGAKTIDPVLDAIQWMIFNSGPGTSLADMKVYEARNKLQRVCGVKKPDMTGDDLIKHFIKITEQNENNDKLRFATKQALLLIGRWQEYIWTNNHIVSRLLDILKDSKSKVIMAWVIDTIGNLSRVYPVEGRDQLASIFESLTALIKKDDIEADMEEVCLRSIIWTGHHLQFQVARFLSSYEPVNKLSQHVEDLVSNFAGTRGKSFCEKTVAILKNKSRRGTKRRRAL